MTKILIVDDEPSITQLMREALDAEGYEVSAESDGLKALGCMLEAHPDLVISDVMMPGMGGAPLLTAMQENAYLNTIPVIVMSGRPEQQVRELCSGYAAFLAKPFPLDDMLRLVQEVLEPGRAAAIESLG